MDLAALFVVDVMEACSASDEADQPAFDSDEALVALWKIASIQSYKAA